MAAKKLKKIRSKLGLTQSEAAHVFALSGPNVISNIETGFRKPSRLTLSVMSLLESLPMSEARKLANSLSAEAKKLP